MRGFWKGLSGLCIVCTFKKNGRGTYWRSQSFCWPAHLKLKCPFLDQTMNHAWWKAAWWEKKIVFGKACFGLWKQFIRVAFRSFSSYMFLDDMAFKMSCDSIVFYIHIWNICTYMKYMYIESICFCILSLNKFVYILCHSLCFFFYVYP